MRANGMTSKVVVALYGGLGNQLFQYATARALAERSNAELVLDLAWFEEIKQSTDVTPRNFALAPFNLKASLLDASPAPNVSRSFFDRIKRKLFRHSQKEGQISTFNERAYTFDADVLTLPTPVRLNGYWQSYNYFSDCEHLLKSELSSPQFLSVASQRIMDDILSSDSVCLHVRRGDYVTDNKTASFHGTCGLSYYQKGLEIISKELAAPNCFVFTDDPSWVKENMTLDLPMTVVDVNGPDDAHQDLWLMAACKHFIIANSTLSWWAAWLANYDRKIVVSPARWFLSGKQDIKDLIPADWIQL